MITTENNISVNLEVGENNFRIYTDIECQGIYSENIFFENTIKFYPNPVKNKINIEIFSDDIFADIIIFDLNGRLIKDIENIEIKNNLLKIDLSDLYIGSYLLEIGTERFKKKIKFIKE